MKSSAESKTLAERQAERNRLEAEIAALERLKAELIEMSRDSSPESVSKEAK